MTRAQQEHLDNLVDGLKNENRSLKYLEETIVEDVKSSFSALRQRIDIVRSGEHADEQMNPTWDAAVEDGVMYCALRYVEAARDLRRLRRALADIAKLGESHRGW